MTTILDLKSTLAKMPMLRERRPETTEAERQASGAFDQGLERFADFLGLAGRVGLLGFLLLLGMRIALGGAWRMIVAGEMLASQSGIGSILMESRYQFRATDLMMAMILISIVGYITERLIVGTLEKKTTERWEVKVL